MAGSLPQELYRAARAAASVRLTESIVQCFDASGTAAKVGDNLVQIRYHDMMVQRGAKT